MPSWWPWHSLREAYAAWQALESRRLAAHQRLTEQYLNLGKKAESLELPLDQGLLRAARQTLEPTHDPLLIKAHNRLQRAFAILGRSFFRPVPADLQMELRRYAAHIDAVCQDYGEMSLRLHFAQKIISLLRRKPESGGPPAYRLALISPEAALLVDQLRQQSREERQARQTCLAQERRARLANCQRWLQLLQQSMPPKTQIQFLRNLKDLALRAAVKAGPQVPAFPPDYGRLDLLTIIAHRQATRTIAGLLSQKSN